MKQKSHKRGKEGKSFLDNSFGAPVLYEGKHLEGLTTEEIELVKRLSKIAVNEVINQKRNSE